PRPRTPPPPPAPPPRRCCLDPPAEPPPRRGEGTRVRVGPRPQALHRSSTGDSQAFHGDFRERVESAGGGNPRHAALSVLRGAGRSRDPLLSLLPDRPRARLLPLVLRRDLPGSQALLVLRGRGLPRGRRAASRPALPRVPARPRPGEGRLGAPGRVPGLRRCLRGSPLLRAHLRRARAAGGRPPGQLPRPRSARAGRALLALPGLRPPHEPAELRPALGRDRGRLQGPRRLVQPRRAAGDRGGRAGGAPRPRPGAREDGPRGGAAPTAPGAVRARSAGRRVTRPPAAGRPPRLWGDPLGGPRPAQGDVSPLTSAPVGGTLALLEPRGGRKRPEIKPSNLIRLEPAWG